MHTKTLVAIVTRGGPTFFHVVRYLSASNRRLNLSLLIYKTRRFDCCLPTYVRDGFRETHIVDHSDFLYAITARYSDSRPLFASLDNVALWKSIVLFYAYTKRYDHLILWDEDQYPIWVDRDLDYFEPLLAQLSAGYKIASTKRYGYLNSIPLDMDTRMDAEALGILERCLTRSNEIAYPGMFLDGETEFVRYEGTLQKNAKWTEGKWVASGECAYHLKAGILPLFFQPPGARGEDTFFCTRLNDPLSIYRSNTAHFHDPHGMLLNTRAQKWEEITIAYPQYLEWKFTNVVKGWLGYAPLYVRLEHPDWKEKIQAIYQELSTLYGPYKIFFEQFQYYTERLAQDYEQYQRLGDQWFNLVSKHIG